MRIAATIGAFVLGVIAVGFIRMATQGELLGFVAGGIVGLLQLFLFFGVPWLVWRAMEPKSKPEQE